MVFNTLRWAELNGELQKLYNGKNFVVASDEIHETDTDQFPLEIRLSSPTFNTI